MTASRRKATDLTDAELRPVVTYLAKLCLEIERGLRPPDHLQGFVEPRRALRWRDSVAHGRFTGGPVVRQDLGVPQVSRIRPDHAVATIVTRTEGARWGAITLQLRAVDNKWRIAELQRLLAASHYRGGPDSSLADDTLAHKIERATVDRRAVAAALRVARQPTSRWRPPGMHVDSEADLRQRSIPYLERTLRDLDRELLDLRLQRSGRSTLHPAPRRR